MNRDRTSALAAGGIGAAALVVALAIAVPAMTGWQVHSKDVPPLNGLWRPRLGPGSAAVLLLAVLAVVAGPGLSRRLRFPLLLCATYAAALGWLLALAYVDGNRGIDRPEYLRVARQIPDVPAMLHQYVSRIPLSSPGHWPVHLAGHPPGAVLFFVGLVRAGVGSGFAVGGVITLVAATTPVAVLLTARTLGAESAARAAAPFLAFAPAAIWSTVSGDAVFAAIAAWGLCLLAVGATRRSAVSSVTAGLLLGYCLYLSYGLALLGILAVGILVVARRWYPLGWAAAGVAAVVVVFTAYGFAWWEAYPVLRDRYYAGVAARRPASYWLWGDLAAFTISAGLAVGASIALSAGRARDVLTRRFDDPSTKVASLVLATCGCLLLADLSLMSKAEVERIWLPFVPWALLGCALLPRRWQRPALGLQVVTALAVQHLVLTGT